MAELFVLSRPRTDEQLSDAEARARALDITRSWIVEAPAGSGKTGLMLQRFLKLLATVEDPAQVLAITFTRKATAELHDRALRQLTDAQAGKEPENEYERATRVLADAVLAHDRELGWDLLDHPHRLNVRTIDSLARDIAAGLPVLSNAGGAQSPEPDAEPLYAEAAHRTLMQLGGPDQELSDAIETIMLHRDGNLIDCRRLIASMLGLRDQWGELIPLAAEDLDGDSLDRVLLPKFERALELVICRGLSALAAALPEDLLQSLASLGAGIGHSHHCTGMMPGEEAAELEHWYALIELLLTNGHTYRKQRGITKSTFGGNLDPAHKAQLVAILDRVRDDESILNLLCSVRALPPPRYSPEQWVVTKALFQVLARALAELQIVFSTRGVCDFGELGLLARAALRTESALDDLRASAGMNLQHLLVDEMQDTSTSQYELVELLTQRWDGHSQTVFLVGDPKQSIYAFRQARVERFIQTMRSGRLGELTLGALHLTANFRSQRNLVDEFNADFALIFPATPDPLQPELVPYLSVTAVRAATAPRASTWHTAVLPHSAQSEQMKAMRRQQRRLTAAEIRPILNEFLSRPLPAGRVEPWRIAILVRNRIHLAEIVVALRQAGIPYRANEIDLLSERQEVLDLIALTRSLLHPADRTAWLALLRSPWCGLGLADLHLLTGADDPAFKETSVIELMETRGDLLSEDGIARLKQFWPVLAAALEQRGRMPLSQWVHRTWLAFRSHLYAGEHTRSNVEALLRLLDELEEPGGGLSLPRLTQRMTRLYAAPAVTPGAVDLMTMHGAKGLEWDFVLLPGLERPGMNTNGRLLEWMEIGPSEEFPGDDIDSGPVAPGVVAPIRGKNVAAGKLNDWMRSLEKARSSAETRRLFYVACTRAREELHLFANIELNKDGERKPRAGSLLAAAWPAASRHFAVAVPSSNLLRIPSVARDEALALAATGAAHPRRLIERIPAPPFALTPPVAPSVVGAGRPFAATRPQGNYAARALGNATHAFLEQLAARLASGSAVAELREELPRWSPRIHALLRSTGLAPHEVQRLSVNLLRALMATLEDATGRWILAPHPQAASEAALIAWDAEERSSVRLDRSFLAGDAPLSTGETHLWIIDYKTATHGADGLEEFLAEERERYRPQLEAYARQFATHPRRVGLFYPLLQRLLWWPI